MKSIDRFKGSTQAIASVRPSLFLPCSSSAAARYLLTYHCSLDDDAACLPAIRSIDAALLLRRSPPSLLGCAVLWLW